jgi:hypothetical protein
VDSQLDEHIEAAPSRHADIDDDELKVLCASELQRRFPSRASANSAWKAEPSVCRTPVRTIA